MIDLFILLFFFITDTILAASNTDNVGTVSSIKYFNVNNEE